MANFDWIPYMEGRYFTYYQIGTIILSAVCLLFAFLSFIVYLMSSKVEYHQLIGRGRVSPLARSVKNMAYTSIFLWLSFIPLICQALDVLNILEGMVGMFAILFLGIYLDKGIKQSHNVQLRQI